jgi:hypothetical protein
MADKKVARIGGRPITPTQKMEAALSDPGTMNVADASHDKGKSVLADKFREREERWRREQAMHSQQSLQGSAPPEHAAEEGVDEAEQHEEEQGGRS